MRCVCLWCVDARCAGVALAALASALRSAFHPVFIFHVGSGMCHRDGAARLRRAASEMILVCKSTALVTDTRRGINHHVCSVCAVHRCPDTNTNRHETFITRVDRIGFLS